MDAQIKDQNCKHNGLQSCEFHSNDRRAVDFGSIKMGLKDASNKMCVFVGVLIVLEDGPNRQVEEGVQREPR